MWDAVDIILGIQAGKGIIICVILPLEEDWAWLKLASRGYKLREVPSLCHIAFSGGLGVVKARIQGIQAGRGIIICVILPFRGGLGVVKAHIQGIQAGRGIIICVILP